MTRRGTQCPNQSSGEGKSLRAWGKLPALRMVEWSFSFRLSQVLGIHLLPLSASKSTANRRVWHLQVEVRAQRRRLPSNSTPISLHEVVLPHVMRVPLFVDGCLKASDGDIQTSSAIPMTRRHPHDALLTNPNDTAPPRPCPGQQSPMTRTTPWSAIPMTRRRPHDALLTNPNDTAPPRPRPGPQSPRHGDAQTRPPQQQSPWHSATHATHATRPRRRSPRHSGTHAACPAAIPRAQRHTRHTRDVLETQIPTARN